MKLNVLGREKNHPVKVRPLNRGQFTVANGPVRPPLRLPEKLQPFPYTGPTCKP